ncbi:hypothetical protein TNCV_3165191 [Trichonephila clavipes]|nr:hypothetical protein TNCV_3165191 [Trichonephila clavipes]
MELVIPTGNGIFHQDSIPCQKSRTVLERPEEHKDESQLISWPTNLEGNLVFYRKTAHIPSCRNISTLRKHCLDSWHHLYLHSSTKNLWYPCQGELQLFCRQKVVERVVL